jgi:hypothetical protein
MTIILTWPDGSTTTGASFPEVEAAIRAEQWHTFVTRRGFRREMYRRARLWSGREPSHLPRTSEQFVKALVSVKFFKLEVLP